MSGMSIMAGAMAGGAGAAIDQINILQADDLKTKQEKRLAEYREAADRRALERQEARDDRLDERQRQRDTEAETRQRNQLDYLDKRDAARGAAAAAESEKRWKAEQGRLEALWSRNNDTDEGRRAGKFLELAKQEQEAGNVEQAAKYRRSASELLLPPPTLKPKPVGAAATPAGNSTAGAGRGSPESMLRDKTKGGMGTNLDIIDENISEITRSIAEMKARTDMKPGEQDSAVRGLEEHLADYQRQRERFVDKDGKPIMQRAVESAAAPAAEPAAKPVAKSASKKAPEIVTPMTVPERREAAMQYAANKKRDDDTSKPRYAAQAKKVADAVLSENDIKGAAILQASEEFALLDKETKQKIYNLVNGAR